MTEQNLPDDELEIVQDEAVSGEEEDFLSDQTLGSPLSQFDPEDLER